MNTTKIDITVNEIMDLFTIFGNKDYIGEPVSQIEHMTQCAQLAEASGADNEVIIAALLHDIGHLCEFAFPEFKLKHMDSFGIIDHEKFGGQYLKEKGFADNIVKMVESHVNAKRYLTYKYPEYYNLLSEASKNTLEFQGGKMSETEAIKFEGDTLHEKYIALRRWDEQAKEVNKQIPDLNKYKQ
jgi:2-amino-1-hydroxyethylphosphonate dioxygenase (glycine-forming)